MLGIPEATPLPIVDGSADGALQSDGAACAAGQKACAGGCVSVLSPASGCADPTTCEPCLFPHATAICAGGACAVGQCELGFIHCSDLSTDGCEVDPTTDDENCGSCGVDCTQGGSCVQSQCECDVRCDPGVSCDHDSCAN